MKYAIHILGLACLLVAPVQSATVQYQYDSEQRLTRATYSTGQQIDYAYDATGNPTSAVTTAPANQGTVKIQVTPAAASWAIVDSAGVRHSGSGNLDVSNIPFGRVEAFWKPCAPFIQPSPNPSYGVLTGSSLTLYGIYTTTRNTAVSWTCYE